MSRQDEIKQLLVAHTRRKHELELQRALAGYSVDPKVSLEIEDIEKKIDELLVQLKGTGEEIDLPQSIGDEKINSLTLDLLERISEVFLDLKYDSGKLLGIFYAWEQVVSSKLNKENRERLSQLEERIVYIAKNGTNYAEHQKVTKVVRDLADSAKSQFIR